MKKNLHLWKILLPMFFGFLGANVFGQTTETASTAGDYLFTTPCDVSSIIVELWGAGGGGQRANGSPSAGGGGSGGGYIKTTYSVTGGTIYNIHVGTGGLNGGNGESSWFDTNSTLIAVGGRGAGAPIIANNTWGTGAAAFVIGNNGGATVSTYGGSGGNAGNNFSGGSGSSAGNVNGNNAVGITRGLAPVNGYAGVDGRNSNLNGATGNTGSGGSGGRTSNGTDRLGGNGGAGQVRITYTTLITYCGQTFSTVEPITKVSYAGINNSTSSTINGSPDLQSFCFTANVLQGGINTISLKGNTAGPYTNFFRVYIDWDHSGTFGNVGNEIYDIGAITNSTGVDGVTLTGNITVPLTATLGNTRMRVVKNYNSYTGPCTASTFGQAEDYTVNVAPILPCTGTPSGGVVSVNPNTGSAGSTYDVTASGYTTATGLTFQWRYSDTGGTTWTNQAVATPTYTSLTGMVAPAFGVVRTWQLVVTCTSTGAIGYSSTATFTSGYCSSTVTSGNESTNYISEVDFRGTLLDTYNTSTFSSSPNGYQDFTGNTPISKQADGNGINIYMATVFSQYYKAWVDWNKDGVFSNAERVYTSGTVQLASTTFGFIIPSGTGPGNYRIRLRANGGNPDADPCGVLNFTGETEDYLFEVIANCSSNILTAPTSSRCGAGSVMLQPTATAGVTEFRWYASAADTIPFATTINSGNTTTYNTANISATTTYWVTSYNGMCESLVKTPITAVVNVTPSIAFTPTSAEVCGSNVLVSLSATGSDQIEYLINEDFEDNTLAPFTNQTLQSVPGKAAIAAWQLQPSIFTPAQQTWFPAISSGINANKFVMATSDVGTGKTENALVSPIINTLTYTNLTLNFKMYYSRYYNDNTFNNLDYAIVEVSTNGGATYPNVLENITYDVGIGTQFATKSYNLDAFVGQSNLRFRIRYYAEWCDGLAIDNIELFGEKPLAPSFNWTSSSPVQFYTDSGGTNSYNPGDPASIIYVKFSDTEIENTDGWNITATATLTNSCAASGKIKILNKTKVWDSGFNDWNTANWKPNINIPTNDKCVIIKTPVNVPASTIPFPYAEAKNILFKTGGTLNIQPGGILKVTDVITSTTNPDDFVIEDDGILLQTNSAANIGQATAQRYVTDMDNVLADQMDYVYWSAPVSGQGLQAFSPGTKANRIYYYNEPNDKFYAVPLATEPNFLAGKGYAIQAETMGTHLPNPTGYDQTYSFKGNLNNGDKSITINRSLDSGVIVHGYNLIGNPYPSNINFDQLYFGNSTLIYNTAYFWTNNTYEPTQQQQGYSGNNYAIYNGTGGNRATAPAVGSGVTAIPNGIVKVGQGIIVQKKTFGVGTLQFKHNYIGDPANLRVSSSGTFFQKNAVPKNRFWIKLTAPNNLVNSQLIAYVDGATDAFDGDYDAEAFGLSSDVFYSILDDKRLLIQGKANNFSVDDIIPVGANFFQNGNYTIALDSTEGIFAQDQVIYLKDKVLNTYTDLKAEGYTFNINKGITEGRFEIVYKTGAILTTDSSTKYGLEIYRDADDFVVRSPQKDIKNVEVYDASGRLIIKLSGSQKEWRFAAQRLTEGIFVVKATLKTDETVSRKIRK